MCKLCKTSNLKKAKIGLWLGYPKCCIKYYLNGNSDDRILLHRISSKINISTKTYYEKLSRVADNGMVMCDKHTILYNKNKLTSKDIIKNRKCVLENINTFENNQIDYLIKSLKLNI